VDLTTRVIAASDFLIEISGYSASSFWIQRTPKHLELSQKRKGSTAIVGTTANKRSNVYYQSIRKQLWFLGIGGFASCAFLIPQTYENSDEAEWRWLENLLFGLLFVANIIAWYGTYGVLFNQLDKSYACISQVTAIFRERTTFQQAAKFSDYFETNVEGMDGYDFDL